MFSNRANQSIFNSHLSYCKVRVFDIHIYWISVLRLTKLLLKFEIFKYELSIISCQSKEYLVVIGLFLHLKIHDFTMVAYINNLKIWLGMSCLRSSLKMEVLRHNPKTNHYRMKLVKVIIYKCLYPNLKSIIMEKNVSEKKCFCKVNHGFF